MVRPLVVVLCAVLLGAGRGSADEPPPSPFGPFPIRNFQPLELLYYQPEMTGADVVSPGRIRLDLSFGETNTLISGRRGSHEATVDLEMSRLLLAARYGLTRDVEIGLDLPLVSVHAGVLDGFIREVEDFVSEPRALRAMEDRDSFTFFVQEAGRVVIDGTRGKVGVGDLALVGKWQLWRGAHSWPRTAVRAALELPTGDVDDGLGSGTVDGALGVVLEHRWRNLSAIVNANVTMPGGELGPTGPDVLAAAATTGVALLVPLGQNFALVGQFAYYQGVFDEDIAPLRGDVKEWTAGLQWLPRPDLAFGFGLVEDAFESEEQAADVTFFVSLRWMGNPVACRSEVRYR